MRTGCQPSSRLHKRSDPPIVAFSIASSSLQASAANGRYITPEPFRSFLSVARLSSAGAHGFIGLYLNFRYATNRVQAFQCFSPGLIEWRDRSRICVRTIKQNLASSRASTSRRFSEFLICRLVPRRRRTTTRSVLALLE